MGLVFPFSGEGQLLFSITTLLILSFCYCSGKSVEVIGTVECSECKLNHVESSHLLSGRRVAISCKVKEGKFRTRGVGGIKEGKFKVALPDDIVDDNGKVKEECFAQLQITASSTACSGTANEKEASKIVYKFTDNGKHILGLKGKLDFSPTACTSLTTPYFFNFPFPPYLPPYLNPNNPPLRTEPLPRPSDFPPLFAGFPPLGPFANSVSDDPHTDEKYAFASQE
ncbi:hypothetical protein Syun_005367 [Stephania yunnanensis]|uniref:Uncharacterized protein n=1 Tax=Stephania yunnanensis TaxID=152371 RepID=A0AAP0L5L1_9MAGN